MWGFCFGAKNGRDKDNTAVRCQITALGSTNYLSLQCRVLSRALLQKKSKPLLYPVCMCLWRGVTNDWCIIIFQNNGNLGHAANLGMAFMDSRVPYIHVLVTEDIL